MKRTQQILYSISAAIIFCLALNAFGHSYKKPFNEKAVSNSPVSDVKTGKYSCGVYLSFFTLTQYITLNDDDTYIVLKTDGKKNGSGTYTYNSDSQIEFSGYLSDWVGRPKKDTQFYLTQKADLDKSEYDQNWKSQTCTLSR